MSKKDGSPFIAIPSSLAGIFLVIVIITMVFAKEYVIHLLPLLWGFVVLGVAGMFFAYLAERKKK